MTLSKINPFPLFTNSFSTKISGGGCGFYKRGDE
jgi:hypothetical protein